MNSPADFQQLVLILSLVFLGAAIFGATYGRRRWGWKFMVAAWVLIAAAGFFSLDKLRNLGEQTQCLHIAKSIALACRLYANDHGGRFPPALDDLFPKYINMHLSCPGEPDKRQWGYDYFGGKDTDLPEKILLRSRHVIHGRRAVVYCDADGAMIAENAK